MKKILNSITADKISSLLLHGYFDSFDHKSFDENEKQEQKYYINALKLDFTDEQVEHIKRLTEFYMISVRENGFAIGLQCGVKLLFELLKNK